MGAFRDPLGLPWGPLGLLWEVSRGPLGSLWGSFGAPWGCFLGSVEALLAAEACLGGPLGVPGGSWDVLGRPLGSLWAQGVPWGAFGSPRVLLGGPLGR